MRFRMAGLKVALSCSARTPAGNIYVAACRMVETEHLTGPSFDVPANDKAALRKLL